jgi:hypothetical protein
MKAKVIKKPKSRKKLVKGMVFCRGCAKKIHETAVNCPYCGAPQGSLSKSDSSRNVAVLVLVGIGWAVILWGMFIFTGGFVIGLMHPDDAANLGGQFGKTMGGPILLVTSCLSALLTTLGWLPGTFKK